jgi:hypothetical protein
VRFVSLALLLALLVTLRPGSAGGRAPVLSEPAPGKLYHGVFPGGRNGMGSDITPQQVRVYAAAAGKRPTWVYVWDNWYEGREFPWKTASWIRDCGSVPYLRLMMMSYPIQTPDPTYNLDRILAGSFDPDLRAWMRAARKFGSPLVAEYGTEVNGWWFPWNGLWNGSENSRAQAVDKFRRAYRHIIQIAREESARNIRWVFHVDPWDEPVEDWNRFENYYPGDEWIDWLGVSVYGRQLPSDARAISFRWQMDWVYGRLTKMSERPVIVCEFGTIRDRVQAAWAKAALSDLVGGRWPRVIGFAWWNAAFYNDPKAPGRRSDMRIENNPALTAVFRRYVGLNPAVE